MAHKFRGEISGQICVERAIAEIRAGRPVVMEDIHSKVILCPIEALDASMACRLGEVAEDAARLVLTSARLSRLGNPRDAAGYIALPTIDLDRIRRLVFDDPGRVDAPIAPTPLLYEMALDLLGLAHVLPAAIIVPIKEAPPSLLSVALPDVLRFRRDRLNSLKIISRAPVPLEGAPQSEFVVFRGGEGLRDQVAVIVGTPNFSDAVSVRLHSACLTGDLFGSLKCDCGDQLRSAVRYMAENGGGVLLYIDQEGRGNGLSNKIRAYALQAQGYDTFDADAALGFEHDQRKFEFAAEMLKALGVTRVRAMTNNPAKIAALCTAGLDVVSEHRIRGRTNEHNIRYLASKRDRAGHLLEYDAPAK